MKNSYRDIGDIYRDAFKDYRLEPSDKAWADIESKISKPALPAKSLLKNYYFIAAASVLIIAVIAFIAFRNNESNEKNNMPDQDKNITFVTDNPSEETKIKEITQAEVIKEESTSIPESSLKKKTRQDNKETKEKPKPIRTLSDEQDRKKEKTEIIKEKRKVKSRKTEQLSDETETINEKESKNDLTDLESSLKNQTKANEKENSGSNEISEDMPIDPIEFPEDKKICRGEEIELEIKGGQNYLWSNGDVRSIINVSPVVTTVYGITVTDAGQNNHYGNVKVEVYECMPLFVPDAFTPDGDGLNDVFRAKGNDIHDFSMRIHSRSGNLIFESNDINQGWDGRINGSVAETGIYFYTISFVDSMNKKHNLSGHVTLLR